MLNAGIKWCTSKIFFAARTEMLILHVLASNFLINTCPVHVILKKNIECYLNLTMISVLLNIYQPYFSAAN